MASFKEIVTKAVIGKGKKQFTDNLSLQALNTPTTVLGCYVPDEKYIAASSSSSSQIGRAHV